MPGPSRVPALPLSTERFTATGRRVPACYNCQHHDHVRPLTLTLHDVAPGIDYWSCASCGFVWATRDGQDLRSARR
jgi:hypothetical protein